MSKITIKSMDRDFTVSLNDGVSRCKLLILRSEMHIIRKILRSIVRFPNSSTYLTCEFGSILFNPDHCEIYENKHLMTIYDITKYEWYDEVAKL